MKLREQIGNHGLFFQKFVYALLELGFSKFTKFNALDDAGASLTLGTGWEGADQSLFDTIGAIRSQGHAVPITLGRHGTEGLDSLDRRMGG